MLCLSNYKKKLPPSYYNIIILLLILLVLFSMAKLITGKKTLGLTNNENYQNETLEVNKDKKPILLFNFSFKIGLNNKILKVAIKDS